MSIVLKENEWAERMIAAHDLGQKPSETLRRVARYYLDHGYKPRAVMQELEAFMKRCDPEFAPSKWVDNLEWAVKKAAKCEAVNIDAINITDKELETIAQIQRKPVRRLAFTLLCLGKYQLAVSPDNDGWINCKSTEVMALADISVPVKQRAQMYQELTDAGLIRRSRKVDSTGVQVCFMEDGETVLRVTDFRSLGHQYQMYCGEPYFKCENCGLTVKYNDPKNRRRQKYCKNCAIEVATQQRVNAIMRRKYGYSVENRTQNIEN